MRRTLTLLVAWCTLGCSVVLGPDQAKDSQTLFDEMWREFDLHYAFFEYKGIDWAAVRAQHLPLLKDANHTTLLSSIRTVFDQLDDPHVVLVAPGITIQSGAQRARQSTYFSSSTVFAFYVTNSSSTPHMRFGKATANTGYVWIRSFVGSGWGSEIDEVLQRLGDISGLIIDVRNNGGGNDGNGAEIAGRFMDQPRIVEYVRFRNGPRHSDFTDFISREVPPVGTRFPGKVVVLANRGSASASETFVLMMRVIPGVHILGDSTAGASGNPLQRELSNGWYYQLSEWINYTADKQIYEGIGLGPSIVVQQTAADSTAGIDRQLERAIQVLAATP